MQGAVSHKEIAMYLRCHTKGILQDLTGELGYIAMNIWFACARRAGNLFNKKGG